jgi:hypothetical protein
MPFSAKPASRDRDYIELVDEGFASDHSQDDLQDDKEMQPKFNRRDSESSESSVNLALLESSHATKEIDHTSNDNADRLAWQVSRVFLIPAEASPVRHYLTSATTFFFVYDFKGVAVGACIHCRSYSSWRAPGRLPRK